MMAKESTADKPAEGGVTQVYFTDQQLVASLQAENLMLREQMRRDKIQFDEKNASRDSDDRKLRMQYRELQAMLLQTQDRVTVLQDKLLALRAVINAP
jgi:hypothetical protein